MSIEPKDRLIIALDSPDHYESLQLAKRLSTRVGAFKIGPVLFCVSGPSGLREIAGLGPGIFLDLKLHDIPSTVSKALSSVPAMGGRW